MTGYCVLSMKKMLYSHHALLPYFAYIPTTIVIFRCFFSTYFAMFHIRPPCWMATLPLRQQLLITGLL